MCEGPGESFDDDDDDLVVNNGGALHVSSRCALYVGTKQFKTDAFEQIVVDGKITSSRRASDQR